MSSEDAMVADLRRRLASLDSSQWLPAAALEHAQLTQLNALVRHATANVPWYRQRLGAIGELDEASFEQLPVLTRSDVQQHAEALMSEARPSDHGRVFRVRTSGSTGTPIEVALTAHCNRLYRALMLREHRWHERDPNACFAAIRPLRGQPADAQGHAMNRVPLLNDVLGGQGRALLLDMRLPLEQQWQWLVQHQPHYLLTYPSNLAALLEHAAGRGSSTRLARLRHVRTVSEVVDPSLRALATRVLGVPIVDEYSAQETGPLAIQCPRCALYHVQSESVRIEIVDDAGRACDPGQTGRVLVTCLHNFAMPLIRYAIGDFATAGPECECGRGLPTLAGIDGRQRNMLRLPGGQRRWPLPGYERYRDIAPVRQYQIRQHALDALRVLVVAERALTGAEQRELAAWIRYRLGETFEVEIVEVDAIERNDSGKFEDFVCELDD